MYNKLFITLFSFLVSISFTHTALAAAIKHTESVTFHYTDVKIIKGTESKLCQEIALISADTQPHVFTYSTKPDAFGYYSGSKDNGKLTSLRSKIIYENLNSATPRTMINVLYTFNLPKFSNGFIPMVENIEYDKSKYHDDHGRAQIQTIDGTCLITGTIISSTETKTKLSKKMAEFKLTK